MKIIHNQTNINGFSLALTVVRLPPHTAGDRHDQSFHRTLDTNVCLDVHISTNIHNAVCESTRDTGPPTGPTEVYPNKNLNFRTLNELQSARAARNIRSVVGKVNSRDNRREVLCPHETISSDCEWD